MIALVKDPYERNARAVPALLLLLPVAVPLVCVVGPRNPLLTAIAAILGSCGAVYAVASVMRGLGKATEDKLVAKWGGMPSTVLLRHRDTSIERPTKLEYHRLISERLGLAMPTEADEAADPAAADQAYRAATRKIRELTRGAQFRLLLTENTAYGFHRNMMGARWLGLATSTLGVLVGLVLAGAIAPALPHLRLEALWRPGLEGAVTLAVSLPLWCVWWYFGEKSVRRIANVYAERLFEALRSLPKPRASRSKVQAIGG